MIRIMQRLFSKGWKSAFKEFNIFICVFNIVKLINSDLKYHFRL